MNTQIVPMIERAESGSLVVTSETIAQGAGVEHRAVLQMISKHQARVERFGQVAFEMRLTGKAGSNIRVALLNEQQSTLIMSFMRNTDQVMDFKEALVDGFFRMAEQIKNMPALSEDEIVAQALQITSAKVLALTAKIEADAPKVNFWDQYCSDDDKISFRTMASVLKVGEHDLREGLIYAGWIYGETRSRWSDTQQKKIERNRYSAMAHKKHLFDAVQNADVPRFGGELMHTLKANLAGAEAIGRWVEKIVAEFGSLKAALPVLEQRYNERKKKVS